MAKNKMYFYYMRFLAVVLLWLPCLATGQSVYFEKMYGTTNDDWTRGVRELPNGFIYTAGYSNNGPYGGIDITVSKLNKYGNVIWTKFYGDSLNNYCLSLELTIDGSLALAGETETALSQL